MTTDVTGLRVLRCRSGRIEWAVAEAAVREVARPGPVVRIPGAPAAILGLANHRGAALTVVDARRLLGQPDTSPPEGLVIVTTDGRRVGLAVDEVDDLHLVPMDAFSLAGSVPGVPPAALISRGHADQSFLLLDVDALLAPLFPAPEGRS